MAGLPQDSDEARIEALQIASINMDARVGMIENLMSGSDGRIVMNQDDLMRQLMDRSVTAGSSLDYAAMEKVKEMLEDQNRGARTETGVRIDAPNWGGDISDAVVRTPSGFPGATGTIGTIGSTPAVMKVSDYTNYIEVIINIRSKLDEFLDGSNPLMKVMNPQTIREMVRELRYEVRELKRDQGISELHIIEYLEQELEDDTIRKDSYTEAYDHDSVPF